MSDRRGMASGLQVKDVYDYAYDIAQEFDKVVDFVDIEHVKPLINKVINVLEILENSVKQLEQLEQENVNLRAKYIKCSCEKTANEDEKLSLKQAFEELEESWSQESATLKSCIDKLKKENQILKQSIYEEKDAPTEIENCLNTVINDQEKLITKLQSHLKQRDSQLENNNATIETLNSKIEDLLELNNSLRTQYQGLKYQIQFLDSEKSENKFKQDQQEQKFFDLKNKYDALKKSLIEKNETKVVSKSNEEKVYVSENDLKVLLEEQQELNQTISKLQRELVLVKYQCEEYKRQLINVTENQNSSEDGRIQQIFRLFLGVVHINM